MATIQVYEEESNQYFQVTADLYNSVNSTGTGANIYYLKINTSIRQSGTGAALPEFIVQRLTDTPPAPYNGPFTNWSDLINAYVAYYISLGELGMSSSSSSSSSSVSSSSSSSSSSRIYSSSSISSYSSWSSSSESSPLNPGH